METRAQFVVRAGLLVSDAAPVPFMGLGTLVPLILSLGALAASMARARGV